MVTIYGLVDPRTDRIRYVGKTNDPAKRMGLHRSPAHWPNSRYGRWMRKLDSLGLTPMMVTLEDVLERDWLEAERWWIDRLRVSHALVNTYEIHEHAAIVRNQHAERLTGRVQPAEAAAKKRATWARRMAEDTEFSRDLRARRSQLSRERGARPPLAIGEQQTNAKLTDARVREARERNAAGESMTSLAREFGVGNSTMTQVLTGKSWKHAGGPIRQPKALRVLTDDDVRDIRRRLSDGERVSDIARRFSISQSQISYIKSGRAHAAVAA